MKKKILLISIFLLLLSTPFLTRPNLYFVGGDDMKLYYLFPKQYLENFAFNIISDNTLAGAITGYSTVAYFAPLYILIYLLKLIPANTQHLMYGLNYAFAFYFFYKLLGLFIKNKDNYLYTIKILTALFYISSPYLVNTLYRHQLLHIYLISVLPAVMYYFIKSVKENKPHLTIVSVLIFSLFTTTYGSSPYLAAFFVSSIPILLYVFYLNQRVFLKNLVVAGVSFVLVNFYWIFHFINSNISSTGLGGDISVFTSEQIVADNRRIIGGVSRLFNPINIIFNRMDRGIPEITTLPEMLNSVYISSITAGGIFLRKASKGIRNIYVISVLSFLLSWFLFSPGFGDWGPKLFLYIHDHFPLFGMFRNMFDKFALSLAFYFSFAFAISLTLIYQNSSRLVFKLILLIIVLTLISNFRSFVYPDYLQDRSRYNITGSLNPDFLDMVKYFKELDNPSRVTWLPLNFPTYTVIDDPKLENQFYFGLSPMRVLAGRADMAGKFSFLTQQDVFLGDKVFEMLENGEYKKFGELLQKYNVKYVIINQTETPDSVEEFMYGGKGLPILSWHTKNLKDEILGENINDFGDSYALYNISDEYQNDKIFLSRNISQIDDKYIDVKYNKVMSNEYKVKLSGIRDKTHLVFLEPFDKNWNLYHTDDLNNQLDDFMEQKLAFEYANAWEIDPQKMQDNLSDEYFKISEEGYEIELTLFFEPEKYSRAVYIMSIFAIFGAILYVIIRSVKLRSAKNLDK